MSSPRMIVTHRRNVFMAHICSECGFPMITVVHIEAEAQKTYTFSQSKAEQIASETAENAIRDEIRNIEACYSTKQLLVGTHKGSGMIVPGHFCTSFFSGFASPCPQCCNIEPWKNPSSAKKMDELDRDNFPIVFTDADKAEMWAFDKVRKMVADIDEKRRDDITVKKAIEKVVDSKIKMKAWLKEFNSIPEAVECNRLKSELSDSEKMKSQLGIFDMKGKRAINEKIKILQLQVKDLNDIIAKKQTPIARRIVNLRTQLLTIQSIAFGCSDNVLNRKNGNAISYFLSPNDIPEEIRRRIESSDTYESTGTVGLSKEEASDEKPCFCRKCGFKLLPGSIFCTRCGTKVE